MNFPDFGELIFPRPVATQAKKAKQSYVGLLDRRMKNYVTLLQITSEVKKKKKKTVYKSALLRLAVCHDSARKQSEIWVRHYAQSSLGLFHGMSRCSFFQ